MEDPFKKPVQCVLLRKFKVETMNIPNYFEMGEMGIDRKVFKKGVT